MNKIMKSFAVTLGILLIVGFQNCARTAFNGTADGSSSLGRSTNCAQDPQMPNCKIKAVLFETLGPAPTAHGIPENMISRQIQLRFDVAPSSIQVAYCNGEALSLCQIDAEGFMAYLGQALAPRLAVKYSFDFESPAKYGGNFSSWSVFVEPILIYNDESLGSKNKRGEDDNCLDSSWITASSLPYFPSGSLQNQICFPLYVLSGGSANAVNISLTR